MIALAIVVGIVIILTTERSARAAEIEETIIAEIKIENTIVVDLPEV